MCVKIVGKFFLFALIFFLFTVSCAQKPTLSAQKATGFDIHSITKPIFVSYAPDSKEYMLTVRSTVGASISSMHLRFHVLAVELPGNLLVSSMEIHSMKIGDKTYKSEKPLLVLKFTANKQGVRVGGIETDDSGLRFVGEKTSKAELDIVSEKVCSLFMQLTPQQIVSGQELTDIQTIAKDFVFERQINQNLILQGYTQYNGRNAIVANLKGGRYQGKYAASGTSADIDFKKYETVFDSQTLFPLRTESVVAVYIPSSKTSIEAVFLLECVGD